MKTTFRTTWGWNDKFDQGNFSGGELPIAVVTPDGGHVGLNDAEYASAQLEQAARNPRSRAKYLPLGRGVKVQIRQWPDHEFGYRASQGRARKTLIVIAPKGSQFLFKGGDHV